MNLVKFDAYHSVAIFLLLLYSSIANCQSIEYSNSAIHKDLANIANKIDNASANAVKNSVAINSVMNGLKSIGNALELEKFRDASESIFSQGDWKLFQATTGLGPLTVVYGNGKFAVLISNPSSQMAGKYDETSPGIFEKGRLSIDVNKRVFKTNPIFGTGENSTLRLVESSEGINQNISN